MSNIIKISRGKYIEDSLNVAIIRLDSLYHQKGVPVMINYYTSRDHSTFDTVFASGVKDGVGRDCYRIISLRQENMIWGVGSTLPDVSRLIHGEKYLYQDPQGKWWLVQIASDGRTRELIALPDSLVTYTVFSDGSKWVSDSSGVRREGDTYSRAEIDAFMSEAMSTVKYVEFDNLTPTQIETLRGHKGDQGDKGERGEQGLQGERGERGYNGTIENFVVLSQADYDALDYVDPYKFYFTYEDEEQHQSDDFYAYVLEYILYIYATSENHTLDINPAYVSSTNNHILDIASSTSMVPTPIFDPIEGTYDGAITITIRCPDPEATIYYTLDRSIPNENSNIYDGAITLDQSTVIKARAYKQGLIWSKIVEATYDLIFPDTVSDPVIDYDSGVYTEPFYITISCPTQDAVIRYTLDGSEPNESSTIYLAPILVEGYNTTIRAKAFKASMNASGPVTRIYKIGNIVSVSTPVIYPSGGTYNTAQDITIECSTNGATIRYTLDGTTPTQDSEVYSSSIYITQSTTVKAKAFRSDMEPSNVATQDYVIDQGEPEPQITPVVIDNVLQNITGIVEETILHFSSYTIDNHTLIL